MLPRARRDYPRFPNPHLRTTAFMLDRMLLLEAGFERAADKRDTYLLESGPDSFTRPSSCAGPGWRLPKAGGSVVIVALRPRLQR